MRDWPSVEAVKYAKQYMPEGKKHYFETEFSNDMLAAAIDSTFLKGFSIQSFGEEKQIMQTFAEALPKMSEYDKGYFMGRAEGMLADKKKQEESESKGA